MKQKLKEYIDTVFADVERRAPANQRVAELKEEMLQNLFEKYDDLIASGKTPAAAYNIAVAGVGDITDLLDAVSGTDPSTARTATAETPRKIRRPLTPEEQEKLDRYRRRSAIVTPLAIALYILCVIPCMLTESIVGVIIMFAIVAAATSLLIYNYMSRPKFPGGGVRHDDDDEDEDDDDDDESERDAGRPRRSPLYGAISGALWCLTVCVYLAISFITNYWHLTWMIFLVATALDNIIKALFDLRSQL